MKTLKNIIDLLNDQKLLTATSNIDREPQNQHAQKTGNVALDDPVETPVISDRLSSLSTPITAITFDSRKVVPGSVFFCKGEHFKTDYLTMAKEQGAIGYIAEKQYEIDLPGIIVKDIRLAMPAVAADFYDYPDQKLTMIGVTGSKGKSTTVLYIKNILDEYLISQNKKPCGVMSTISLFNGLESYEPTLTTPESLDIYEHLHKAVEAGLEYFVMEISSQALKYQRVEGLHFELVALMNLGRDHISPNEHPNYEDYIQSKLKIFDLGKIAVYCKDMDLVERVEERIREKGLKSIRFASENSSQTASSIKDKDYVASDIAIKDAHCTFCFCGKPYRLQSIGLYNVENALCAIAITEYLGVPEKYRQDALLKTVIPGRENFFYANGRKVICFVSYAHNQVSFEKSFQTIKAVFPDYYLVAIFGASGSKGLNRIKDLPEIAGQYADFICFVPDDPGYRTQQEIGKEMVKYLPPNSCPYEIFEEREMGIRTAFQRALESNKPTLLFIAGKGEEHYQMVKGKPVPIRSDLEVAEDLVSTYNQAHKTP